jgi:S1-C subfamily serine protease
MTSTLAAISEELAAAVASAGRAVVTVRGRERMPSSGIHYSPGVIVTADHSVRRTEDLAVRLADGTELAATLAGRDSGTDVAVLKAELKTMPVAERAAAAPKPGQVALVVGRLAEAGLSASMGVISAVGPRWRTWRGGMIDSFVRLDAAVYPGSSGGVVADIEGRLLGMATSGLSRVAPVAVPAATLERVVTELLATGRVSRGYLGVGLQPVALPEVLRGKLKSGQAAGLIVLSVEPGGPADNAGVLIGDIVVALDGAAAADTDDVQQALGGEAIGRSVKASLVRGGELVEAAITIGERPRRGQ